MKWKQMLAIGMSAVTIMSAVPRGSILVHADTKTEVTKESGGKTAKGVSAKAVMKSSEYGNVVYRDTISDETNGTDITWTVYDSGKLVIDGTGVTPDWSPWFYYKEDITDVIIGDGITALGERNFMNYPELKTVTVQGNLSKIGNSAFEGCKKLKNITVEGATNGAGLKVLMLGQCAFKDCTGLENAEFTGNFVTYKNAFEGCTSLRSVKVKESTMIMLGEYTFLDCTALTEADLPGSKMKSIGANAFWGCTSLNKFDFSDVSSINEFAFANCSSLESIKIPSTGDTIAEGAFYGCSGLKDIEIPDNIKTIGKNAFSKCTGIKTLKILGSVTTISESAFASCTGLKEFDIEEGVQTMGDYAFAGCENLKTMILPKSINKFPDVFVTDYKPIERICYRGTKQDWSKANLSSNKFFNASVYFEYNPAHKHEMIERTYTYPDSCTLAGTKKTFCKLCGYVESSEEIPAKGHNWKVESTEKATCTKAGVKHLVCERCGEKKDEAIPASHSFSAWKTTKGATVFSAAVQTRTCSECGKKETRITGKKLSPTMKVNATKLPLKTKQKTKVFKVSGLAKGDSVASWKSSKTSVAKVSGKSNGPCTITAGKKTGKATITVTLKSGLKKNITITVQKNAVKTTKITGVAKKATLKKGKTLTLKPAVTPLTSVQKVTYRSSNKKVATVTSKGVIKAKKKGTAVITVKSGSKTAKCKITIK